MVNKKYSDLKKIIEQLSPFLNLPSPVPEYQVNQVNAIEHADKETLVFINSRKMLPLAAKCQAHVFVTLPKWVKDLREIRPEAIIIESPQVEMAMAQSMAFFESQNTQKKEPSVHPTAIIGKSSQIAAGVHIGPYVVIGERCQIAKNAFLDSHCVLEDDVVIGEDTRIHSHVTISRRTVIGFNCDIHSHTTVGKPGFGYVHYKDGSHMRIPHQGIVRIGDYVDIGSHCSIDRATFSETVIGSGTKIDNHVQIAHNTRIGRNCLLAAQFGIAGSSTIGDNCIAGGRVSVSDHVHITSQVQIGGLSGVQQSIKTPGQYSGYPLRPVQEHLKNQAILKELPKMKKLLNKIYKKIFKDEHTT